MRDDKESKIGNESVWSICIAQEEEIDDSHKPKLPRETVNPIILQQIQRAAIPNPKNPQNSKKISTILH